MRRPSQPTDVATGPSVIMSPATKSGISSEILKNAHAFTKVFDLLPLLNAAYMRRAAAIAG